MLSPRNVIELLAPAKNFDCAKAAVDHGADAVYIGAPAFGARKSASNTIDDIRKTIDYSHLFGVRVFVALNTVLFNHELESARQIAWQLYEAGADALIIQDMGLLEMDLPPIELHASTQMDNRTPSKARFLQDVGFHQVVLARELNLEQIADVAAATDVRLECFVHGALCVSFSGQCYMSQAVNGRSSNRGECAQPCRLKYTLSDNQGRVLSRDKHLLSLKDQQQTANLEALIDAGASTFKIEGRLKDADYVANVTLHYRQQIDSILARRPDLKRASSGRVIPAFQPDVAKSFNRGFTTYFMNGRQPDISQPNTPKSLGELLGRVSAVRGDSFVVDTPKTINNGDGLCYTRPDGMFDGLRVNRAEGNVVYPRKMQDVRKGAMVYRNSDVKFDAQLSNDKTRRVVELSMTLNMADDGRIRVLLADEDGVESETVVPVNLQPANNPDASALSIQRQMAKLGKTVYVCSNVSVDDSVSSFFIPISELNNLRRLAVDSHTERRLECFKPGQFEYRHTSHRYIVDSLGRNGNVVNDKARQFYARHGVEVSEWGYERQSDYTDNIVMTTKHCLMNSMGQCLRKHPELRKMTPLTLVNERDTYSVEFDCSQCQMVIRKK